MTPRARRSESITLPPGNHPGLIQFNNDKSFVVEKGIESDSTVVVDEALDSSEDDFRSSISDDTYDSHDSMSVDDDDDDTQGR